MNIKQSTLAVAVAAALAMGASGQAAAYEYANSTLLISNLTVQLSDNGGTTIGGGYVTTFNFNQTNTAILNGAGALTSGACSGAYNPDGTLKSTNCLAAPTNLDPLVANAPGSGTVEGQNDYTQNGPASGSSYANGDSQIVSAALLGAASTATNQQAEAEINPGDTSASSSTDVSSTTGFNMTFVVDGANQLKIEMDALLDIYAAINDPTAAGATAKAAVEVEFKLSKDNTTLFFSFKPDGAGTAECSASAGLTCTTLADEFDLNTDVDVTGLPISSDGRENTAANDHFGVLFAGLTDGIWSLTLTAKTSTDLSRTAAVPEPGILALMGIGMLGLGMAARRRKLG